MILNLILIFAIVLISIFVAVYYIYKDKKTIIYNNNDEDIYNIDTIVQLVKNTFNDILKKNLSEMNLTYEEHEKLNNIKRELMVKLKSCSYGDINNKNYIKDYIKDILINNKKGKNSFQLTEENINKVINFANQKELTTQDKFDILMHINKKKYGYDALTHIIIDNELNEPKYDENKQPYFEITKEDIENVYTKTPKKLKFEDKLEIIVQRIFSKYKGYGPVDEIRDMKIDGVSGGVSGIPPSFFVEEASGDIKENLISCPRSYDSIWIFFKGKTMHLSFLSFGSEKELRRVANNIYKYDHPGQLSESNGYKVNEMKDGSRVVVARPPFCESWVFFVRKFDSVGDVKPEKLVKDKNNFLPIKMMQWLIRTNRITALTGSQGTGKTTLLLSIMRFINPSYTIRIQEMSFELHARKIYPKRNIVTFRETPTISGQEGLDLQKKTDGAVNILGEVATAPVASWMVQMAQVASLFTMFTHHAKTTEDLVISIRNNLFQTGSFNNEKAAEKQVSDVINFDIHLKSVYGHRYVERITEIIPLQRNIPYPREYKEKESFEEKIGAFLDTASEYFERQTDRKIFETKDIIVFEDGEYKTKNPISKSGYTLMTEQLTETDKIEFDKFLIENWGKCFE